MSLAVSQQKHLFVEQNEKHMQIFKKKSTSIHH